VEEITGRKVIAFVSGIDEVDCTFWAGTTVASQGGPGVRRRRTALGGIWPAAATYAVSWA
jgi:hypothetical protein